MPVADTKNPNIPPQKQDRQPGLEHEMKPRPASRTDYPGVGKLKDEVAVITGGDSGIGRAVAWAFAKEGADVAIVYLDEHEDADETERGIQEHGRRCLKLAGDLGDEAFCKSVVESVVKQFGKIDVLVNNAAEQHVESEFEKIESAQIERTFRTNIFSMFYLTREALKHMSKGARIVNSTSVTAYRGSAGLIDYASTKGAIVSFTRSLSAALAEREIRVNAVAPGPIWTPLIPATFDEKKVKDFGKNVPLGRPGQPEEVAPCYVFLASDDSSYMTGQVLHPNGGEIIGG